MMPQINIFTSDGFDCNQTGSETTGFSPLQQRVDKVNNILISVLYCVDCHGIEFSVHVW